MIAMKRFIPSLLVAALLAACPATPTFSARAVAQDPVGTTTGDPDTSGGAPGVGNVAAGPLTECGVWQGRGVRGKKSCGLGAFACLRGCYPEAALVFAFPGYVPQGNPNGTTCVCINGKLKKQKPVNA